MRSKLILLILLLPVIVFGKDLFIEATLQNTIIENDSNISGSLGFEYFKKFSNDYGDFLSADLQVRVPYVFDDDFPESLTLEIHNAWLEYKAGLGKFIRAGHFSPAFGIESVTDTHGTLAQTLAMKNVGFKQDWGIGFRSFIGDFDYSLAVQAGSGMALRKDSYLISGRFASPSSDDFQYALSGLFGDVHNTMNMATYPVEKSMGVIYKKRVAVDFQYNFGAFYFKDEISIGYNEEDKIVSNFTEFNFKPFTLPDFIFTAQNKYFSINDTNSVNWLTGASYKFFEMLTLSLLYDFSDENIQFKIYYFG